MTVYLIADVTITDPERYAEYIRLAPATITPFGGRYLARGGTVHVLEGDWNPKRLVIEAFDTIDQVRAWLDSPEYRAAEAIRHQTATVNLIVVEGV